MKPRMAKVNAFEHFMDDLQSVAGNATAEHEVRHKRVVAMEADALLMQELQESRGWALLCDDIARMRVATQEAMEGEMDSVRLHRLNARASTLAQVLKHPQSVIDSAKAAREEFQVEDDLKKSQ